MECFLEFSIWEVIVDFFLDGFYYFKVVDGFYCCFIEYELLMYKMLRLIKLWIDLKSLGSMSFKF